MAPTPQQILITGGAGFIGSNLANRAIAAGHGVTILDDLSRAGSEHNVAWLRSQHGDSFRLIVADVADQHACLEPVAQADVVYHLAGQTAITTSLVEPRRDFMANALGTLNVLEAARAARRPPILIHASTNKVYGGMPDLSTTEQATRHVFRDLPCGVDESRPLDFHSPYGCSKGAADQYVRDYARIYGIPAVVFRQSCIYGPRQMGKEDQGWLAWFAIAIALDRPITVYGDGKQVRDALYVDDLIDAYEQAVDRIDIARGQVYNIGGGVQNSISVWWEFKPLLEEAFGRTLPEPAFAPGRPGDQAVFIADVRKAQRELGWAPRTSVAAGVDRLVTWVMDHRSLFT